MQVTVEVIEGLRRRMKVQVSAERVDDEVATRLKSLRGRAKVDGFRPGKVPLPVVKMRFGGQVRGEVLDEVVHASYLEAVDREGLRPASFPTIEPTVVEQGKSLEYTATFEVYPTITLADAGQISVAKPVVEITPQDVDNMVEKLRLQRSTFTPVERAAQQGDQLIIDFRGTIDGAEFPDNRGEDTPLVLGSGRFIPGFEEQLTGARAAESKSLNVTFPGDYHAEGLAGKEARFEVEVKRVEERALPEIDEAFLKSFNVGDGNLETFRDEIQRSMRRELDEAIKGNVKQQVMDGLVAVNDVQVPSVLLEEEINRLAEDARQRLFGGQPAPDKFEFPRDTFAEQAQKRVTQRLILADIMKENDISLDKERLRVTVEHIAAGYDDPEEVVEWYYANEEKRSGVESMVLEDQLTDWVLERAQVNEEKSSYDEMIAARGKAGT